MSKKTYLKDVTFDFEADATSPLGPHIAYTTAAVGGAASGLNKPILLKADEIKPLTKQDMALLKSAKEIRIEMSMEDFLKKFMGMYYDDAAVLAKLLGFESSMDATPEQAESWLEKKLEAFTIIKSLAAEEAFYKLNHADQLRVISDQEVFEKALLNINKEPKVLAPKSSSQDRGSETVDKGVKMDQVTQEGINKALESQVENLQKQLKTFQEREDQRAEEAFINKAKGYSFVGDKAVAVGKVLKSLSDENALLVLEILEKAKVAIDTAQEGLFERQTVRGDGAEIDVVKSKKSATKEALDKILNKDKGDK